MSDSDHATQTPDPHVSARLVRLEPGLFSLTVLPALPGRETGPSGVRVCVPPLPPGYPETVSISPLRADGWVLTHDDPMLIRVAAPGADVLMTLYWPHADGPGTPPSLRLARLNAGAASPDLARVASPPAAPPFAVPARPAYPPPAQPAFAAAVPPPAPGGFLSASFVSNRSPDVAPGGVVGQFGAPMGGGASVGASAAAAEIVAHIQEVGDVEGRLGDWIGRPGSGRWIEGFRLSPRQGLTAEDFECRAVLGREWFSPWLPGSQYCGSRGLALPMRGFCLRLHPGAAARLDLTIMARFTDGTEIGPVGADQVCMAPSLAPLEAFQILTRARQG